MHRRTVFIVPSVLALVALAIGSTQSSASADDLSGRGKPGQVAADQSPSTKMPPASASLTPPLQGYKLVTSALLTAPAGTETYGSVTCPSGKATGGGAIASSTNIGVNLNSSWPLTGGTGWQVYIHNQTGSDDTFAVYVVCAKKVKAYAIVASAAVNTPAGGQTAGITANCATGSYPYGGGVFNSSGDLPVLINTSIPLAKGWRADVNNGGTGANSATAYAICGKRATGYTRVIGTAVTNPANSQTGATATCPSGTQVFGGGEFSSSPSTAVNMNSTAWTSSTTWTSWQNNATAGSAAITPYALCASVV